MSDKIKNIQTNEDDEFGLDFRYGSVSEKKSESIKLMQTRLDRMKKLSKEQIMRAKLLQLKLKMEQYLTQQANDNPNQFANFLEMYIDAIYDKRNEFARDINITPVFLSQIINSHREPKEEFILKLMIHSEKAYNSICAFSKKIWYQVYFHEKICDTLSTQEQWRPKLEKQVKFITTH